MTRVYKGRSLTVFKDSRLSANHFLLTMSCNSRTYGFFKSPEKAVSYGIALIDKN